MSINSVKVLELVAIVKEHEKSYLRIKFLSGQEFELFLEIDDETTENLNSILEFDGNHKYRLSLHISFDTTKNQYKSLLTKTYRDISERIYFNCSINFKNCLESIKNSQNTDDLYKLPFLSKNLSVIGEKKTKNKPEKNEEVFTKEYRFTFKWTKLAIISVVFVLLIGYLYFYLDNTTGTVVTNAQIKIAEVNIKKEKSHITDTKLVGIDDSKLASIDDDKLASIDDAKLASIVDTTKLVSIADTKLASFVDTKLASSDNDKSASIDDSKLASSDDSKLTSSDDDKLASSDDTTQLILPSIEIDEPLAYSIPEGYVALTFDDGPSKHTVEIADILKKYKVGGTFFFVGVNIQKFPDSVRYVQSNGYSIGSHSMNHSYMPNLSTEGIEDELLQSAKAIEDITKEKLILFRPPYGAFNEQIQGMIHNQQYKIVLWNNDTEDWRSRDSEKIVNHVRNTETSGSIILLHESQAVIDALPQIIENLQERDLKIVNLN